MSQNTHILVSQNSFLGEIRKAAAGDGEVGWTCPKTAVPGDRVFFYITTHGIIAEGIVEFAPQPSEHWPNRYAADISGVRMLPVSLPLEVIVTEMPGFGWARYPRSYVSLSLAETKQINTLLRQVQDGKLKDLGNRAPLWLNVDKPCKTLVIHTRNGCPDERRKGYGKYKPVGELGKDGGWLPFDNFLDVESFAKEKWPRYAKPAYCSNCARRAPLADLETPDKQQDNNGSDRNVDKDVEVEEGARTLKLHLQLERNRSVVEKKRKATLKEAGRLNCEVCDFDFVEMYGPLGQDFCEVHHRVPLHELKAGKKRATKLEDLAVVCSNCHRMLHRGRPKCYGVDELKRLIIRLDGKGGRA